MIIDRRRGLRSPKGAKGSTFCRIPVILLVLGTILVTTMEVLIVQEARSHSKAERGFLEIGKRSRNPSPDGYFNGYPVYYQQVEESNAPSSQIHCIGETNAPPVHRKFVNRYIDMSWADRSCHFQFFCFDTDTKEYVIFPDAHSIPATNQTTNSNHSFESQQTIFTNRTVHGYPYAVSIGGVNRKWSHQGFPRLKWFPRVEYIRRPTHFYTLPSNVTIIPFHSLAAFNPGHLLWDDFLPLFTLAQIFHLDQSDLLLLRHTLKGDPLWATCDWKTRKDDCDFMLRKFGPLMIRNVNSTPALTQNTVRLHLVQEPSNENYNNNNNNNNNPNKKSPKTYPASKLVCARHGLAGLGALTDHGVEKGHGWEPRDYDTVYNHGRGGQLWRFRNFMLRNVGIPISKEPLAPPYRIIFSEKSSASQGRSLDFTPQIEALYAAGIGNNGTGPNNSNSMSSGGTSDVRIETYKMNEFTVKEQMEIVSHAAIYVTGCGGGAVTATFLPRGSSIVLYYDEDGGVSVNVHTNTPARLDWDYFNNMGYSRVHWYVKKEKDKPRSLNGFVELIRHQLDLLRYQRKMYEADLENNIA